MSHDEEDNALRAQIRAAENELWALREREVLAMQAEIRELRERVAKLEREVSLGDGRLQRIGGPPR